MRKVLTSPTTVLALILLLTGTFCIALFVPQSGDGSGPSWSSRHPSPAALVREAGLDHVFSTWWFLAIAVFFLLSLTVSTYDQYRVALKRMLGDGKAPPGAGMALAVAPEEFIAGIRRLGFLPLGSPGTRCVKNSWGYWGNFFLHAGMTVTALFAVVYAATEDRFLVRAVQGEDVYVWPETVTARRGLLARAPALPASVRLEKLTPRFWENGQLMTLESEGFFTLEDGRTVPYRTVINDAGSLRGMLLYQRPAFGAAFRVALADGHGAFTTETLLVPQPQRGNTPGYGSSDIPGGRLVLKAKYVPDPRAPASPAAAHLTLRLLHGDRLLGEATLREGETAGIGPLRATLVRVSWWTEYLFDGSRGTLGIFAGFSLILLGVLLMYFCDPRVVTIHGREGSFTASWHGGRFAEFNREELDAVLRATRREEPS